MDMTQKARDAYTEMVGAVEKELAEASRGNTVVTNNLATTIADVPRFFSHMGHSRTPSGCSGISLTSSILSEPISENYPYSEPETDNRGFEVFRRRDGTIMHQSPQQHLLVGAQSRTDAAVTSGGETLDEKLQKIDQDLKEMDEQSKSSSSGDAKVDTTASNSHMREDDEGNEADTEDDVIKKSTTAETTHDADDKEVMDPEELPGSKDKTLMKARVEEWVARTQEQVERLDICEEGEEDNCDDSSTATPTATQ